MKNLDKHFKVRRNFIFECACFNKRSQLEGETAEQFIMELQSLVEHCEYGDLRNDMVRDRLVVGIRDGTLSERLQLDSKLTLESAMKQTRQREAVHEGRLALKGDNQSLKEMDTVGKRRLAAAKPPRQQEGSSSNQQRPQKKHCTRCGREPAHSRDRCPAKDAACHKCKKKGHFSSQCHSKVPQNTKVDEVIDEVFLDTLTEEQDGSPQTWKVTLRLDGEEVLFKVDTGAEVTAILSDTLQKLTRKIIKPSQRSLVGPSHQPLKQKGQFQAHLELQWR